MSLLLKLLNLVFSSKIRAFALSLLVTFICFYFFETTFLIETAFAEEASSSTEKAEDVVKDEKISPNKVEKSQTFLEKVWSWKWYILAGLLVSTCLFFYFTSGGSPAATDMAQPALSMQEVAKILNAEGLPAANAYVEHHKDVLIFSQEVASKLPEHFQVTKAFYSDASMRNVTGIFINGTPLRVYPSMPILSADPHNPIFNIGNQPDTIFPDSAAKWGYSTDPSTVHWISQATQAYPTILNVSNLDFTLQYQKVALVDPITLHYSYFHQVSLVPTNVEALSQPFETNLAEKAVRIFFFQDNERGWHH